MSWTYLGLSLLLMPAVVGLIDVLGATRAKYTQLEPISAALVDDYAVLVPIWGATRYLENVEYLATYGSKVVLCTPAGQAEDFYNGLNAIAERWGFSVFVGSADKTSSAARRRQTGGTTRDRLIREVLHEVTATHVVCIDGDTVTERNLGELVGEIVRRDLELASVPLQPSNRDSWLARLQGHEYRVAMSLRRIAPWLISGGCHAGRTDALCTVMDRHSLFFQGNDVETGIIGSALGMRVGHVPFVVPTVVPSQVRPWFRQRLAWAGGEFRLFIVNFQLIRRHPLLWAYGLLVMFAAFPFRWLSAVEFPQALAGVSLIYLAFITFINWRTRDRWLLVMPFYVAFNSLVMVGLALPSYAWMAWRSATRGLSGLADRGPTPKVFRSRHRRSQPPHTEDSAQLF